MSLPIILDVAIGLALMYLMLSLAVTTINEIISTIGAVRAKTLSRTVTLLIDDEDLRKRFYDHGLIVSSTTAARGGLTTSGKDASSDPKGKGGKQTDSRGVPKDKGHPSYLDSRVFALALLDSLGTDVTSKRPNALGQRVSDIKSLAADLPLHCKLRDVLLANIAMTEKGAAELRDHIAGWFDAAMERLSGDFARRSKAFAFWIGFILAAALNADSFAVSARLWSDKDLRTEIVEAANRVVTDSGVRQEACAQSDAPDKLQCLLKRAAQDEAGLRPFPIGWDPAAVKGVWNWITGPSWTLPAIDGPAVGGFFMKLMGLAFTGVALSLGAPFWFDLLNKFMSIRGAGPKPSTLQEKKAKAAKTA